MEQAQAIKARLANLRELRKLFQALRAMAAGRLHEGQDALAGIRAHVAVVEAALSEALALVTEGPRPLPFGEGPPVLIAVCAEHGFVGGFNARLLDRAEALREKGERLVIVGSRGATIAAERGFELEGRQPMATHAPGVPRLARNLFPQVVGARRVRVVFGAYRRGGAFDVTDRGVLPPEPAPQPAYGELVLPLTQMPPAELVARLYDEYLFAALTVALMESFASENAARLQVMEAADRSIADKLEVLQRAENDLRQEAITEELLDVVTGAEAITSRRGTDG
ncbi:F0F1 ATP synthase subunit gamma [Acidimangrovimonas pyrenivorans]|uniref:F0F1 ATP synthase subunit gamma n=1 Tax=Acidimangrovimonas pyrenivorans TaxID=2030798 RepID=A0ABV7ACV0_9RHOB